MIQKWNFLSFSLREPECSGWGGHQCGQWQNLGLCMQTGFLRKRQPYNLYSWGWKTPFHPCADIGWYGVRVIVPRERQGTTDLSAISATVRGNCCVRWPGGSTDSGDYSLRSTILSNYLFTESEERTFSLLLGLYKYLFFKYCVKALSSAHL